MAIMTDVLQVFRLRFNADGLDDWRLRCPYRGLSGSSLDSFNGGIVGIMLIGALIVLTKRCCVATQAFADGNAAAIIVSKGGGAGRVFGATTCVAVISGSNDFATSSGCHLGDVASLSVDFDTRSGGNFGGASTGVGIF